MRRARFSPVPVSAPWMRAFGRCLSRRVVRVRAVAGPTVYRIRGGVVWMLKGTGFVTFGYVSWLFALGCVGVGVSVGCWVLYVPSFSSSIICAKPSTARWLVKISPPYFRGVGTLLLDVNAPVLNWSRTWVRLCFRKRCSRTGMKVGV